MVVIGASAGGVEALQQLVSALPEDLAAPVFVVLHLPEEGTSTLPAILNRAGRLPAAHAADAEHIRPGRIYVAPPGRHLLASQSRVRLSTGPKENGHRPAIDPLFRSAAGSFGASVVAVLLSGTLDDGTAGFHAVKHAGGTTMVQDPEEAAYRGMIDNALYGAPVDVTLPARELGAEIGRVTRGHGPARRGSSIALEPSRNEPAPVETEPSPDDALYATSADPPGSPSGLTCPECQGVLWDVSEGSLIRFRCRVGHAYNGHTLDIEQSKAVEAALWSATRMLEERAMLLGTLAGRMQTRNHPRSARQFSSRAEEALRHAGVIRAVLAQDPAIDGTVPAAVSPPGDLAVGEPVRPTGDNEDQWPRG